jgi:hypothetical protein
MLQQSEVWDIKQTNEFTILLQPAGVWDEAK